MKKISVETTAYDGDVAFPEAEHYPEFVATELAKQFPGAEIEVSEGPRTGAWLYEWDAATESDDRDSIVQQVQVELWDAFCAGAYQDYSVDAEAVA